MPVSIFVMTDMYCIVRNNDAILLCLLVPILLAYFFALLCVLRYKQKVRGELLYKMFIILHSMKVISDL